MSASFDEIIKRHRPRGWKIYHSKHRTKMVLMAKDFDAKNLDRDHIDAVFAEANYDKKTIRGPLVVCEYTLHCILHEIGHVKLEHWTRGASVTHKEEFEADRWAAEIMRLEGVPITNAIKRSNKRYLKECIESDERKGVPIHSYIRRKLRNRPKKDKETVIKPL